ncbi:MAG: nicotinamidase [Planctomycetota bacterium]
MKATRCVSVFGLALSVLALRGLTAEDTKDWALQLRSRSAQGKGSPRYHTQARSESWSPKKTAVIVCDMWDLHHCLNATRRGAEMTPRMNKVLLHARSQGATIIHAPSSCTNTYKDHPARKNAQDTPRAATFPKDISNWSNRIPSEEKGKYPIDQSDGGEDDDPAEHKAWAEELKSKGKNPRAPWTAQAAGLEIHDQDFISDNGQEVWSILEHKGLDNVILLGVHTNMCVLGRPFGLRQMARAGKNVVLMRDMTDTMYNPARWPYVSHFTGTDLIVEHIEKFVCPTITSDQLIGGETFRFKKDKRPHVVIVMAEREYKTEETLPEFAATQLGKKFRVSTVHANAKERNDLPGIEVIRDADVVLLSVRRRVLAPEKMKMIRDYVVSGKPLIGIRTASHAFHVRGKKAKKGFADWPEFDRDVIGGSYSGHHGNGPKVALQSVGKHEIL